MMRPSIKNIDAEAVTGHNEASRNISIGGNAGVINTGDASVNSTAVVNANTNNAGVSGGSGGGSASSDVVNTGDGLTTNTTDNTRTTTIVNNGNTTIIGQSIEADAVTGENVADRNISIGGAAGVITTGDATVNTNYLITANGNVAMVGGDSNDGGPGSGASIYIADTGNFLTAGIKSQMQKNYILNNSNRAYISQKCGVPLQARDEILRSSDCSAITGYNNSNRGIAFGGDAGVITTGDAEVHVALVVEANKNKAVVNSGSSGASAATDLVNSGDSNNVNTEANDQTNTTINNSNSALIDQDVNARAITGYNKANRNIAIGGDAGIINTGNATVNVAVVADVNSNEAYVDAPSATLGNGTANAQGSVYNSGNGTTINTTANTTKLVEINNLNNFDLRQAIRAYVQTGGNRADKNIGSVAGVIDTGDATVTVNTEITANTNFADPVDVPTGAGNTPEASPTPVPQPTGGAHVPPVAEIAGTARGADGSTGGSVLGATSGSLPATGAESGLFTIAAVMIMMALGLRLRKASKS
ncbi:MAG: hypothetical protein UZ21_OP11001000985 [Microgenomates bacterium OLB22]|nr:MAG: hypothetical protein UZ21_OP11001000985 [Microgenomates bacterium OLB22]